MEKPMFLVDKEGNYYYNKGNGKGQRITDPGIVEMLRKETHPAAPERFKKVESVVEVQSKFVEEDSTTEDESVVEAANREAEPTEAKETEPANPKQNPQKKLTVKEK